VEVEQARLVQVKVAEGGVYVGCIGHARREEHLHVVDAAGELEDIELAVRIGVVPK